MNCKQCGANMSFVEGRGYFRCEYCLHHHLPDSTLEGVTATGASAEVCCPVCSRTLLRGELEGQPIRYCEGCLGWLSSNALFQRIVTQRRAKHSAQPSEIAPFCQRELLRKIGCPDCHKEMDAHPYYGGGNVVIDTCATCQLVWLDFGELRKIASHQPRGVDRSIGSATDLLERVSREEQQAQQRFDGPFKANQSLEFPELLADFFFHVPGTTSR